MRKLLTLFFMCLAMSVHANQVQWIHSFSGNTVVHDSGNSYSVKNFIEDVGNSSLDDTVYAVRMITDNTYMTFSFEWGEEQYNLAAWYDGDSVEYSEYQFANVAGAEVNGQKSEDGTKFPIANWETFNKNWNDEIIVELYVYNDDSLTMVAYSDIFTFQDIKDDGLWMVQSLETPKEGTKLIDFYSAVLPPVPEPSITILALLGACAMLLKRK